ncbi:hypothetical protein [Anoxybacteroides amylolyticum]|uniref:Putative membrane protein n=1 Tax=Anoxybacteroides amylolyticum TaxID=294699 RepID=A0A167TFX6_9BACL|nr:hypothetical protein [Anoxybacillus amylolyticus]ANB60550.1 putative membrane protein [Anoxybacillus amylolyticus]
MHKHLPMEEEVMDMLVGGFSFIMFIAVITIVYLWRNNRAQQVAFLWIFCHFFLLSIGVYFAFKAISFNLEHAQASVEISLLLGKAGISWGAGMICLLIGVAKLANKPTQ